MSQQIKGPISGVQHLFFLGHLFFSFLSNLICVDIAMSYSVYNVETILYLF